MKENLKMIKCMEKEHFIGQIMKNTKVNFKTIKSKVKVNFIGQLETTMKENLLTINEQVKELFSIQMEINILDSSSIVKNMEEGFTNTIMAILMTVNGNSI